MDKSDIEEKVIKHYSSAFKREVVRQIERGELTVTQAYRRYGLGGRQTVYNWLSIYGRYYKRGKVMRIEKPGEVDRVKQLEQEKQELESAFAQAQLKILALESTMEIVSEEYGIDFKKKLATNRLKERSRKSKKK